MYFFREVGNTPPVHRRPSLVSLDLSRSVVVFVGIFLSFASSFRLRLNCFVIALHLRRDPPPPVHLATVENRISSYAFVANVYLHCGLIIMPVLLAKGIYNIYDVTNR